MSVGDEYARQLAHIRDRLRACGAEVYVWYDDEDGWREIMRTLSDGRLS